MNTCTSTHGQDYLYITSNFKYILIEPEAITRKVKPGSSLCVSKLPSLHANCATAWGNLMISRTSTKVAQDTTKSDFADYWQIIVHASTPNNNWPRAWPSESSDILSVTATPAKKRLVWYFQVVSLKLSARSSTKKYCLFSISYSCYMAR